MKNIVVIYHGDCPDGFGGAWAAYKRFGDRAEYIPVHHGLPPIAGLENKEIYMIDITYPVDVVKDLIAHNLRVTTIDHHITAEAAVKLTKDYSYAIDNSGSVLAWKYFHKDEPVPLMLQHIEDQDLWKFKLRDTHSIMAFIESFDYDFKLWDKLVVDMGDDKKRNQFIEKGSLLVNYREEITKRLTEENKKLVEFEGHRVFAANAPSEFADSMAHSLYTERPPMAIIWSEAKDGVHVSLRSDGSVDVSKMAQKFGGGGHKASAGFELSSINTFPWKEKK